MGKRILNGFPGPIDRIERVQADGPGIAVADAWLFDLFLSLGDPLPQPAEPWPIEFDIPQAATADGVLDLQWELLAQRGCQVAEVWLIKQ